MIDEASYQSVWDEVNILDNFKNTYLGLLEVSVNRYSSEIPVCKICWLCIMVKFMEIIL